MYIWKIIILILSLMSAAYSIEIVNGREYDSLNGVWYQIENDSLRWRVSDTSISVIFVESASGIQIDSLNNTKGTTIARMMLPRFDGH